MSNVRSLAKAREAKRSQETPKEVGKGFTLLHRKIQETEFYRKDSQAVHLWVHLIMSANYTDASVKTEYGVIQLQRGQFITGRNALASETGIEPNRIQYLLKKFKKLGMIETASPGKFTVITIKKYGEYQGEIVPEDSQKIPRPNADVARLPEKVVPEDSQKIPTTNNINTNNSISKDIECPSQAAEFDDDEPIRIARKPKQPDQPKRIITPYEEMVSAYHEILPEMAGVEVIRGKRKAAMRKFWNECNQEYQKAHGKPFTIANWRNYLEYIAVNCTWMMQERPNGKGGFWQAKNLDYLVTDECYTKVKEQRANDRK